MGRTAFRRPLITLGAAGFVLALTACGNASETGVEKLIESQGGGDVDVDLSGDDGFSVQTEDGGMSVDEDGSFSAGATTELPAQWPAEIPEPNDLAITSATVIGSDTEQAITVAGTVDGIGFVESYANALESAGFNEDSTFASDGTINNVYSNGSWTVGIVYFGDASETQVTVSVYSNS